MQQLKPRRSVLYMPGSNARALEKAKTLSVDSLIFDLEDAVSPDAKQQAREQITQAVNAGGYGEREVIVRVNGLDTEWGKDDIAAIAKLPIDGVLLPKIDQAQQVLEAIQLLDENGGSAELPIWIMAETPQGMFNIESIAGSHPRLKTIVMGTSDLAKEMRVRHTPDRIGMLVPLSLCVMAARVHGLDIVDGVYLDLENAEGFEAACIQGRDMGFDGKTLIHPKQIAASNQVFAPSEAEIKHAEKVIQAWDEAQQAGKGVVVVSGRLVENLHVEEAKRMLALSGAIQNGA
ncbi:MAG: CoA ester lyase [Thiotrichaceae bacterium]|nr:CoA ester lyase [Thiotrichaceae bacterium]